MNFLCSTCPSASFALQYGHFCTTWSLSCKWPICFVIPPNSNTFSDWRRTCHVSLVKTSWRPRATTTWPFDSHVIRSCTFETAADLFASRVKQIFFYAVMAAKRFQTRTKEEIEQLLHDKSSKSINKATDNAVRMLRDFCYVFVTYFIGKLLGFVTFCNKVVNWHPCIVLFWVGRYNKTLNDWPLGKHWVLFPLDPQCSIGGLGETKVTVSLGASH